MKLLTENNNHIFIPGQTRSGKTYFAIRAIEQVNRPVIFFNIQDEDTPHSFILCDYSSTDTAQLLECLKSGGKIDLRLPLDAKAANNVIALMLKKLMAAGYTEQKPVYIVLDECHVLKDNGLDMAVQIATRGLKRGCRAIFITQRPALANKTLYTQAAEQYMFYLAPSEKSYLQSKGLDYDTCLTLWQQNGDHSYIYYDGFTLEGRRAI